MREPDARPQVADDAGERRERRDLGVAVLVDAVADHLARARVDRGVGVVAVLRAGRAVAVDVEVGRVGAGAVLVDAVVGRVRRRRGGSPGLVSSQSAGRRTPSPSASPSISSHELRVSPSSLIAVSWPAPQSTCSARPSREMMLSSPGAAVEDVEPAAAEQPVVAGAAVEDHRQRDARADGGDVVAAAEVEQDGGDRRPSGSRRSARPGSRCTGAPPPRSAPPKRVKRMLVPVSKPAIWSTPASPL